MKKSQIISIFLSLLTITSLQARPTLTGPTGLVTMPTAESLKYKEYNLVYDYQFAKNSGDDAWSYKANLGTFKNWELGVVGGSIPEEGMFLNAKYYLMSDESRYPVMIALGLQNLSSKERTDVYMVASKQFQNGLGGHFGFKARFADTVDPTMMAGADYSFNNYVSILGDITGQKKEYTFNLGLDYTLTQDIMLRGTVTDLANNTAEGTRWGIGLAYSKFI